MDIVLNFPLLDDGEESGLNDAGIETFEGDIGYYIARECGQNTSDASDGKVELHFNLLQMSQNELPCIEKLKNVFERCKSYWKTDPKTVKFFDAGLNWMDNGNIPVLKVSDYGTSGLTGEDNDRTGKWYGLVRSKYACIKSEGSGGSFGIGKYAPFAASALRTVYYYTRTEINDAFQGISRLVTHCNEKNVQTQATGYIGYINNEHKHLSIRDKSYIPCQFLRSQNQLGTDIYIPAYREHFNWKEKLIISVLNNFWPAIFLGKILFKIDDETIDKSNIDSCVEENRNNSDFTMYRYYKAYRNGTLFSENLKYVGDSELRLIVDNQRESNPIAVARKNGMIIDTWGNFRSRKPISGIYICHDPAGNEILRNLEPPRHDKWDHKRGENGKEIISTIRGWIRSCIEKLIPADESESFDLDVFSKYVPDNPDEDNGEEPFDQNNDPENRDGFQPTPTKPEKNITKVVFPPAGKQENDEEQETEVSEEGEGEVGGRGQGRGNGVSDGEGDGSGKGGTGDRKITTSSIKVLHLRHIYDNSNSSYKMYIRSKKPFEGDISFGAECDDGDIDPLKIRKVIWNNQEIPIKEGGKSITVKIQPTTAEIYIIFFEHDEKMSLRII